MCAPKPELKDKIYNYTLMPLHMNDRFNKEELQKAEFVEGFSFTKGMKVLKIPSKDKYNVTHFGNLLFDLKNDPKQEVPLNNPVLEADFRKKLKDEISPLTRSCLP